MLQGTLYPDVIESCPPPGKGQKHSHTIKSHHNVGGLPEDLQFELIEPLRELFKARALHLGALPVALALHLRCWLWLPCCVLSSSCILLLSLERSPGQDCLTTTQFPSRRKPPSSRFCAISTKPPHHVSLLPAAPSDSRRTRFVPWAGCWACLSSSSRGTPSRARAWRCALLGTSPVGAAQTTLFHSLVFAVQLIVPSSQPSVLLRVAWCRADAAAPLVSTCARWRCAHASQDAHSSSFNGLVPYVFCLPCHTYPERITFASPTAPAAHHERIHALD